MIDKYGYVFCLFRYKFFILNLLKFSSNFSSFDFEWVLRNSILDCDVDESSIGSFCLKCFMFLNGDDDVFYLNSYGDFYRGLFIFYKFVYRLNWYGYNVWKGIIIILNLILFVKEDM